MKDLSRKSILAALLVCAAMFVSQEAGAQKKSRKQAEILNGTIVYVDPLARTSPVEEKLKAKNKPALEYTPTKTVYLYPKGQNIDQGIVLFDHMHEMIMHNRRAEHLLPMIRAGRSRSSALRSGTG